MVHVARISISNCISRATFHVAFQNFFKNPEVLLNIIAISYCEP